MFSLQLFGGASIQREGKPLRGPVTQRRRLALLALLAVPPSRSLSRDKLIGYLWPESDTDRARHLLSEALYVIRKALGEGAVLTSGDEVRLDPEVVTTDVNAFERALDAADSAGAVTLYRGPFLDGFFLSDAPEFERWVEQERARLASCQQKALEAMAQQRRAAADLPGAADAWRQLVQTDPYNSRFALQLMQALAAAGDRAGALQHARVHAILLWEEFQAEPDPEIAAYAERLRREPPAAAQPKELLAPPEETREQLREDASAATRGEARVPLAAREPFAHAAPEQATPLPLSQPRARSGGSAARGRMPPRSARTRGLVYAGIAVVVALVIGLGVRPGTESGAVSPAEPRSIAVLPFVDMSPERSHEYFGDGLAEELINVLARLEGVRVAARTSAFLFKGGDANVREIGRQLGVTHVVEGSVRVAGNRLRVTAQLISVADGYHLWSEVYDAELTDVFEVQDDISRSILSALRVQFAEGNAAMPLRHSPHDLEAYNLYLQGRFFWNKRTPEGLARGMEFFQQALERVPSFAPAHAGLADSYALLVTFGALSPREGYPLARVAAERALALDPALAEAQASLALVKLYHDRDWAGADAAFQRALELSPSYATGRHWYSHFLACRGEMAAALEQIQRARELDPLSLPIKTAAGTIYRYARHHEEAGAMFEGALEMDPSFWPARGHLAALYLQQARYGEAIVQAQEAQRAAGGHPLPTALLGYAYALDGRHVEARQILMALTEQARHRYISPAYLAAIHTGLEERDLAFHWLDAAFDARDDWMIFLRAEPAFDPLRSDPRFAALLTRVGP